MRHFVGGRVLKDLFQRARFDKNANSSLSLLAFSSSSLSFSLFAQVHALFHIPKVFPLLYFAPLMADNHDSHETDALLEREERAANHARYQARSKWAGIRHKVSPYL